MWFVWNAKHVFQYIHYNNSWVFSNTSLTKISVFEHRTKWILYQELPAHFRQKPKHAAKREKALTEIEEKRVNYSSVTYSLIMVGFLKLLKVITKYSVGYTRQCKNCTTCMLSQTYNYKNASWQQILHTLPNQIYCILINVNIMLQMLINEKHINCFNFAMLNSSEFSIESLGIRKFFVF